MTARWHINDIIDLEYLLRQRAEGRHEDDAGAAAADRRRYLDWTRKHPGIADRRAVLKYWLEQNRRDAASGNGPAVLPGDAYRDAAALAGWVLCMAAALAGAGLAWSLLSYDGKTPVNVFRFLWVLLVPQVLLLGVLAVSACVYRLRRAPRRKGIYPLLSTLIRNMTVRVMDFAKERMPRQRQNRIRSILGLLGQARTVYGDLFFWPVFNLSQMIGLCFNLGILAALLLRVTITDVAFGWQSTLQPDPGAVLGVVEILAVPWSWFTDPPVSHPTAAQVAGSKMVLKDGIYHLATGDLVSWWPFLCLCVAFYGLLPRAALLTFGLWRENRLLARLTFTHAACDRLWLQMTTPGLETGSRPYNRPMEEELPAGADAPEISLPGKTADVSPVTAAIVVLPAEAGLGRDSLFEQVRTRLGLEPSAEIEADGEPGEDARKLHAAVNGPGRKPGHVVLVQEAWQPPIKENLAWIRHMSEAAGAGTALIVGLVGKPGRAGSPPAPVTETEQVIWQQAVDGLGDAYLRVEVLGG